MAEIEKFYDTCRRLESGEIRVAEKKGDEWIVNTWIKEVILSGFRLGNLIDMNRLLYSPLCDNNATVLYQYRSLCG